MGTLVTCQSISKHYGARTLFEDLSVGFSDGERVGFLGPNGAGKTTFLKILAGLVQQDRGDVNRRRYFWLAEGFSGGLMMAGGLCHELANWIVDGEPHMDLSEVDPRRFGPHADKAWAVKKIKEAFAHNFGIHYPGYEWQAARPARNSPCYERLDEAGAVWGSVYGWETPLWFAPEGEERRDIWSYRQFNSLPHVADECRAAREAAGLIDMTHMAKFEVSGPNAESWLNRILANRMPTKTGRMVLAHFLTENGTVRAEFSVTRLAKDLFYLVATPRSERHDFDILQKCLPEDGSVTLKNNTLERGCFTVIGPNSRKILQPLIDTEISNGNFPWMTAQVLTVGPASGVRMMRVNYEGELGWELYHPIDSNLELYDAIIASGKSHSLKPIGNRAIESLRLEKSYRAMYRDMNVEYTALESGLDRFIKFDKPDFVGKQALLKQRDEGLKRKMVTLQIETIDADAYMNEGVYADGKLVGRITSGATSHILGGCLSMAYLDIEHAVEGRLLEVPVLDNRCTAKVIADSPYDPENLRLRDTG